MENLDSSLISDTTLEPSFMSGPAPGPVPPAPAPVPPAPAPAPAPVPPAPAPAPAPVPPAPAPTPAPVPPAPAPTPSPGSGSSTDFVDEVTGLNYSEMIDFLSDAAKTAYESYMVSKARIQYYEKIIKDKTKSKSDKQRARAAIASILPDLTANHGRFMRQIRVDLNKVSKALRKETDATKKADLMKQKTALQRLNQLEVITHQHHLNVQLGSVKKNTRSSLAQIPKEFGLKMRKTANSMRRLRASKTALGRVGNALSVGGNILSGVKTVAKAPVLLALTIPYALTSAAVKLAVSPLHIPAVALSKMFRKGKKYEGKVVGNIGKFLGDTVNPINWARKGVKRWM